MLREKYEKLFFFCCLPGESFFDTRSDGSKQIFSLAQVRSPYYQAAQCNQKKSILVSSR